MDQKRLRKETFIVFFLSFFVMLSVFSIMLATRFSNDGYSDYFMQQSFANAQWKMLNGRLGGAAVEALFYCLGINTVSVQLPFTLALILVIAWCCADLWMLVISMMKEPDDRAKGLSLLAILPAFINISFGEFFCFSNVAIHWIGLLAAGQLAVHCLVKGARIWHRLGAFLLLYGSLSFYQAGIGYFLIWGLLLTAMRGGFHADKKTLLSLLWVFIIGALASIASIGTQKALELAGIISSASRAPSLSVLFRNLGYLATEGQQIVLIDGMHFMGSAMGVVTACLTLGVLISCLTRADKSASVWMILVLALISYAVPYAPHMLTGDMWLAPRTLFSVFSYLSFCGLVIVYFLRPGRVQSRFVSTGLAAVLAVFLLVNATGIYTIGLEQIRSNVAERYEAEEILIRVADYEQTQGQEVTKLGYVRDSANCYTNREAPNAYMDINIRAGVVDWEIPTILSYYRGRGFQLVEVPEEIRAAYFAGHEWNSFNPDEQIVLVGDTLYLGIY